MFFICGADDTKSKYCFRAPSSISFRILHLRASLILFFLFISISLWQHLLLVLLPKKFRSGKPCSRTKKQTGVQLKMYFKTKTSAAAVQKARSNSPTHCL